MRVNHRKLSPLLKVVFVLLGVLTANAIQAAEHSAIATALGSITAGELKHHVDLLAADAMDGREAGSQGGHAAGDYLAGLLKSYHLRPAGDQDSYFQAFGAGYRNVLGLIEGRDPALKSEFILIGAHYDHIGHGTWRNSLGQVGQIHNGADDNASGTSGVLEVAQAFTMLTEPPRRSVLFALWDGEEKGMLGSRHWTRYPTRSLQDLKLAFNIDMIGRLRKRKLQVFGTRTAEGLRQEICRQNTGLDFQMDFVWTTKANADHYSFFERNIPFIMLHTGLHSDYHRPSDDPETINNEGIERVSRLLFRLAWDAAEQPSLPVFRSASRYESDATRNSRFRPLPPNPPRLGVEWTAAKEGTGLTVTHIVGDSAAERAGLRIGDRIVRFGDKAVTKGDQFSMLVLAAKSPADVVIQRPGDEKPLKLNIELPYLPVRLGVAWEDDAGEPGTVVLTQVATGSAAEQAGLSAGDRIYEVDGHQFADDAEFCDLVARAETTMRVLVERGGQLTERTVKMLVR